MKNYDFGSGPKKIYADWFWHEMHTGDAIPLHHLILRSGQEEHVFVFPPGLGKKLAKVLSTAVQGVEKDLKVVFDDRLDNEPMESPYKDLGK